MNMDTGILDLLLAFGMTVTFFCFMVLVTAVVMTILGDKDDR